MGASWRDGTPINKDGTPGEIVQGGIPIIAREIRPQNHPGIKRFGALSTIDEGDGEKAFRAPKTRSRIIAARNLYAVGMG